MATRIAEEYRISPTLLHNLITSESNWDIFAENRGGDRGLVQISTFWPEEYKQAYDPEFSMRFAAKKISEGREDLWVPCSCVKGVRLKVPRLPNGNAADFKPNATMQTGSVVILEYSGRRHLAYKQKISNAGIHVFETNYPEPCLINERVIPWVELNATLVGFYTP